MDKKQSIQFNIYIGRGDLARVKRMLTAGFRPLVGSLSLAADEDCRDIFDLLLKSRKYNADDYTHVLIYTADNNRTAIAQTLLNLGANPNAGSNDQLYRPVLLVAAEKGYVEFVKILLSHGANPDAHDLPVCADLLDLDINQTALMAAALKGRLEIVRLLLEAGADPTIKGIKGKTAYELIAKRKDRQDIAKLLLNWKRTKPISKTKSAHKTTKKDSPQHPASTWKDVFVNLEELCGAPPATHTQEKRIQVFSLPGKKVSELIKRKNLNQALSARDYEQVLKLAKTQCGSVEASVFLSFGGGTAQICVAPWKDKFKTIAALKTGSANYGVTTKELVAVLKQVDSLCPFELTECGIRSLGGVFTAPVKNAKKIAAILFDVCPFVTDEYSGKLTRFQQVLPRERRFKLWWD